MLIFGGALVSQNRLGRKLRRQEQRMNQELSLQLKQQTESLRDEIEENNRLQFDLERSEKQIAIGAMTGAIAHDFNNLLSVVIYSNELLKIEASSMGPEFASLIANADRAAKTGADIIAQLMDYSRTSPAKPETVELDQWLVSVNGLIMATLGSHQRSFTTENKASGTRVLLERSKLTTAILNLLTNARDACTPNDKITLKLEQKGITLSLKFGTKEKE